MGSMAIMTTKDRGGTDVANGHEQQHCLGPAMNNTYKWRDREGVISRTWSEEDSVEREVCDVAITYYLKVNLEAHSCTGRSQYDVVFAG